MPRKSVLMVLFHLVLLGAKVQAQHLWWNLEGQRDATCLYGEITVLATHTDHLLLRCQLASRRAGGRLLRHPAQRPDGAPDHLLDLGHLAATASQGHEADPETVFSRFGGEGEGAHTHMLWPWKTSETFQFFVQKRPAAKAGTTDARYFVYDRARKSWRFSATITCPDGGKKSVATLGGGLNSFLENFAGKDKEVPKLALYRLWLGPSLDQMRPLTRAKGDGDWGQLHDAYFLAEGNKQKLEAVFAELEPHYGKPSPGGSGKTLGPLSDRPLTCQAHCCPETVAGCQVNVTATARRPRGARDQTAALGTI